jgi:vacuolar-type H+-ATPase subunit I/STV1
MVLENPAESLPIDRYHILNIGEISVCRSIYFLGNSSKTRGCESYKELKIMSAAIDNFTKQLHDDLEAVEDRAKSLRKSIKSVTQKSQSEIQSKLDKTKSSIDAKKHELDEYRAKLEAQLKERGVEAKLNIEEWKASREVKKLENRAKKAEDHATTRIFLAMAMMEEAEAATLNAVCSRLDAETAKGNTDNSTDQKSAKK